MSVIRKGIVKWFDSRRGFGFITEADGRDVFLHYSAIEGEGYRKVEDGEVVYYERALRGQGLYATKVKRTRLVMPKSMEELKQVKELLNYCEQNSAVNAAGLLETPSLPA